MKLILFILLGILFFEKHANGSEPYNSGNEADRNRGDDGIVKAIIEDKNIGFLIPMISDTHNYLITLGIQITEMNRLFRELLDLVQAALKEHPSEELRTRVKKLWEYIYSTHLNNRQVHPQVPSQSLSENQHFGFLIQMISDTHNYLITLSIEITEMNRLFQELLDLVQAAPKEHPSEELRTRVKKLLEYIYSTHLYNRQVHPQVPLQSMSENQYKPGTESKHSDATGNRGKKDKEN